MSFPSLTSENGPDSRPGHCSWCQAWLGRDAHIHQNLREGLDEEDAPRRIWMVDAVGELLAVAPSIRKPLEQGIIAERLAVYLTPRLREGKLRRDPSAPVTRETFRDLRTGKAVPQLDTLLKVCSWLKLSPLTFLVENTDLSSKAVDVCWPEAKQARESVMRRDSAALEQIRAVLATALADTTEPPPSLSAIARQLGCQYPFLLKRFPDESRAISTRFQRYCKTRSAERRRAVAQEIRAVICQLHETGVYPSLKRVIERLAQPKAIRYPEAVAAYYQTLRDLSLE